ncbi:MobF family relaxase [Pseudoxanthomonas winnipegensis]|uniref:TrwC relaxase domain-containing protein n=1 Tax=Pseudoxanthomonas winnipegensis TaxID=2480810 RepID=A0A4Q8M3F5_9GAMM|nr:MobF family relaxase [Pseudoxanthomonas winnipegensis]TAA41522.1 hypothetical protein EA655_11310 [Pseudoxanthomonas winnipegensis]
MNTIQRINARGVFVEGGNAGEAAVDYFFDTKSVTYYVDGTEHTVEMSYFDGGLAEELGLRGTVVQKDTMYKLATGFHPDGTPLAQNAGALPTLKQKTHWQTKEPVFDEKTGEPVMIEKGGHRQGFDITSTFPKSLSLLYTYADDTLRKEIISWVKEGVKVSSDILEAEVETRRGHEGIDVMQTTGCIRSHHVQLDNRDGQCHLHVHSFWYNLARGEDGKITTYEPKMLYRTLQTADAAMQNHIANRAREAGFAIHQTEETDVHGKKTGKRSWEIQGLHDRNMIETVSTRMRDIKQLMSEGKSHDEAWMQSRKAKKDLTAEEYDQSFRAYGEKIKEQFHIPSIEELRNMEDVRTEPRTREQIFQLLHEKSSIIDRPTLYKQLGYENMGFISGPELERMCQEFTKKNDDMVLVKPEQIHIDDMGRTLSKVHTEVRYAAKWMYEEEKDLALSAFMRTSETNLQLPLEKVDEAIHRFENKKDENGKAIGFKLSAEQINKVYHSTMRTGGVSIAQGLAGTGKTTVNEVEVMAFESCGFKMLGCAIANQAAKKLQDETGMNSVSVTALLKEIDDGKRKLDNKTVVVVDEAGMIDTRQIYRLSKHCQHSGSKLILQGDTRQLQPVAAGSGMSILEEEIGSVMLTEIRRQKKEEDRKIALSFNDLDDNGNVIQIKGKKSKAHEREKSHAIMDAWYANNCVDEWDTHENAAKACVREYMESKYKPEEKLMLAHTNADLIFLNNAVREELKKRGEISTDEVTFEAKGRSSMFDITMSKGDRIKFTTADRVMNVVNGTEAVVRDIKENKRRGGYDITVYIEDEGRKNKELTFNTFEWKAIQMNYARTVHDSQGQGKEDVFLLGNAGMTDNQAAYVAYTRMKGGRFRVFADSDTLELMRERVGMDRLKENISTVGIIEPVKQEPVKPVMLNGMTPEEFVKQKMQVITQDTQLPQYKKVATVQKQQEMQR